MNNEFIFGLPPVVNFNSNLQRLDELERLLEPLRQKLHPSTSDIIEQARTFWNRNRNTFFPSMYNYLIGLFDQFIVIPGGMDTLRIQCVEVTLFLQRLFQQNS